MDDIFLDRKRVQLRHSCTRQHRLIAVSSRVVLNIVRNPLPDDARGRGGGLGRLCPGCRRRPPSSTAPAGSVCCRSVFRHGTHFLKCRTRRAHRRRAAAGACQVACCSAAALASLPFAVYGGVVADDEEAAAALEARSAGDWRSQFGVQHLEFRNLAPRHADWPAPGPVRHLPQGHPARRGSQHAGHPAQAARHGAQGHQERPDERRSTTASTASSRSMPTTCTATARRPCRKRYFEALRREFGADCEVLTSPARTAGRCPAS
jgi:hypothetical protein